MFKPKIENPQDKIKKLEDKVEFLIADVDRLKDIINRLIREGHDIEEIKPTKPEYYNDGLTR